MLEPIVTHDRPSVFPCLVLLSSRFQSTGLDFTLRWTYATTYTP